MNIKKLITIIILAITMIITLGYFNIVYSTNYGDDIQKLKDDTESNFRNLPMSTNNYYNHLGDTVNLGFNALRNEGTVWCVEKGQGLDSSRSYSVDAIVDIGESIKDENSIYYLMKLVEKENQRINNILNEIKTERSNRTNNDQKIAWWNTIPDDYLRYRYGVAVSHHNNTTNYAPRYDNLENGAVFTNVDVNDQAYANAKLAYIIDNVHGDEYVNQRKTYSDYNSYANFPPQQLLWKYFKIWKARNGYLLPSRWDYSYNEGNYNTTDIESKADNYAQFIVNTSHGYMKNGTISSSQKTGNVEEKDGQYYAGPFKVNFSYFRYNDLSNKSGYHNSDIGLLKSINIGNEPRNIAIKNSNGNFINRNISSINPNEEFYIVLQNKDLNSGNDTIKATIKQDPYELYSTRIWFMYGGDNQQHLVITESHRSSSGYLDVDFDLDVEIKLPTDVSLQKYIVKAGEDNVSGRENRYAVTDDYKILYNTDSENVYNHINKEISAHAAHDGEPDRKTVITDFSKINKPVEIEVGDEVTYKIEVYNNKTLPSLVTIADDFSAEGGPIITKIATKYKGQDYTIAENENRSFI